MKNRLGLIILIVVGITLGALLVRAQSPAPSDGITLGNYNVNTDAELGVRFLATEGDFNKYRSDLNYGRGFRLFNFDFLAQSKEGQGKLFDKFQVNASGWGGDPNEFLRILVEKNKWYRFDSNIRQFDYFNNLTNLALNQHTADLGRKFGDFNLTLLPDNRYFKGYVGYTYDSSTGLATSTYDYSRDEFLIQVPTRSIAHDYRLGFDAKVWVFDISFLQGIRYFKDDSRYLIPSFNPGNNPTNSSVINFLDRELPTRGREPFTRFSAHTLLAKKLDFTGRFIYTGALSNYTMTEHVTGVDSSGNNILSDNFLAAGQAKRHNGAGDIGLTFFATDRLTLSETFRVSTFQISGGEPLSESEFRTRTTSFGTTVLPPLFVSSLMFRFIDYRLIQNTLEGDYRVNPNLSFHAGYRYSDRRTIVGSSDQGLGLSPAGTPLTLDTVNNHTNSVFAGFMARPVSIWTVYFDVDHGTADNVFTRISNYNYNNFRIRSRLKPSKNFAINASLVTKDNNDPTETVAGQLFGTDIKARTISTSLDWLPSSKFSLTGGYTLNSITSDASIIFFLNGVQTNGDSQYFMRDHYMFFNTNIQLHKRATLFLAYRISKDLGQGNRVASSPNQILSSYPLSFQSPEARLTVKVREHVDWNLGWQYFSYHEKLLNIQNYHANLPYTSVRFTF
ncbi:MAG: hypothetical protein PHX83_06460 [Acidobacteriia bacterium]|nr:hypothetical protein [Terriglobia bacterium]